MLETLANLTWLEWVLVVLAAAGIGISKSGLVGLGMFHIVVFANLFGAKQSTGIILPMLVIGDLSAVAAFRRHARWDYVRRVLPPTLIGIVVGWLVMRHLDEQAFRFVTGILILGLTMLQIARMTWPDQLSHVPHSPWFAWSLGLIAGVTTMLANAAGPIVALYLLAVALPKFEFVGTGAWFFLIVNLFKLPFSATLGLIQPETLMFNALLAPAVVVGLLVGRRIVHRIPQRVFDWLLLVFTATAAVRLMGVF